MASSGISDVPAAVNLVTEARDGAARLRGFLLQLDDPRAPWAQLEIDAVLTKLSIALDVIVSDAPAAAGPGAPAAGGAGSDGARPQQSASSSPGHNKRKQSSSSSRSRSQRPGDRKITATLDDDGHVWRKYGQKDIQDSSYPRSYYRCTHKTDQGCTAKRQVQRCETDASMYVVTYYGEHTCRDPSTIPPVDHAGAAVDHASNLISFGPSTTTNNDGGASSSTQYLAAAMGGSAAAGDQLSTSWCTSDDVFSSSAGSLMQVDELIGAVVGSAAGAVTSAAVPPDRGVPGGMAPSRGGGAASFRPPSPSSLGFVMGSLGSIGGGEDDDDMFGLDP